MPILLQGLFVVQVQSRLHEICLFFGEKEWILKNKKTECARLKWKNNYRVVYDGG